MGGAALAGEGSAIDCLRYQVKDIEPKDVEPAPRMGTTIKADFIKGIGKHNDDFIIILDIDKVFTDEELTHMAAAYGESDDAA